MISIFAKHTYFLDDPYRPGEVYLQRVSSRVRAEEIAEYLGAKLNPTEGYKNDTCIYVKHYRLDQVRDGDYLDVLDDLYTTNLLKTRPKIKIIAMSKPHMEYLRGILKNKIIYIPHHHVNHERFRRRRKKIINCGYVGSNSRYNVRINREIGKRLSRIGLNFKPLFNFKTRKDIINYYKTIDLQIIGHFRNLDVPYYHQTKIVNAMSFGIPTIASQRLGYRDVEGFYIPINNMDELMAEAEKMKDSVRYKEWPDKIIAESEKYHISEIAKLYLALK
ncbi:hypothetical protein HYT32_02010 [Candidatus Roizmanbacteria bacterium]|nr:hypothetical protein [Candidatus Roizmanbacteria bacterium]